MSYIQTHCIDVAQGAIVIEQNMRFGLILGRFAHRNKIEGEEKKSTLDLFLHVSTSLICIKRYI